MAASSRYVSKMKQDAIRRSREYAARDPRMINADLPPDEPSDEAAENEPSTSDERTRRNFISSIASEFSGGGLDGDKLLIAALMYMLMKEGGDKRLILALGYILL